MIPSKNFQQFLANETETLQWGAKLARFCVAAILGEGGDIRNVMDCTARSAEVRKSPPSPRIAAPFIIYLIGNLGAGKTTFTRGFLRGLGYEGKVKSPTYTLVESYTCADNVIYHFDFYRLKDVQELEFIGIQDYFTADAICLIEWPENGKELLPPADLSCYIEPNRDGREIKIVAHSTRGESILMGLQPNAN